MYSTSKSVVIYFGKRKIKLKIYQKNKNQFLSLFTVNIHIPCNNNAILLPSDEVEMPA